MIETRFPGLYRVLVGPSPDQIKEAERRRREAVEEARAAKDRHDTRGYHDACLKAKAALEDQLRAETRA